MACGSPSRGEGPSVAMPQQGGGEPLDYLSSFCRRRMVSSSGSDPIKSFYGQQGENLPYSGNNLEPLATLSGVDLYNTDFQKGPTREPPRP